MVAHYHECHYPHSDGQTDTGLGGTTPRAQGESAQGTAALMARPFSDSRSLQSAQQGIRTEIFLEAPFHVESCPPHLFLPTPWCFPGPEKGSGDLGPGDLVTGAPGLPASFLPQDGDGTKGQVSDHSDGATKLQGW